MSNSAAKVGEIFTEAGAAFNKLAEMTMLLHPMAESTTFAQVKTPVKRKAEDKSPAAHSISPVHSVHTTPLSQQVTLNMLNASESEMDVEGIRNDVKLEFETSNEEVPT
ncbi:unnamed protein product [Plutella xylostella]|uniref:(diamondback moth) hypothetical protein n=1 Tax=Plutella xylostella TaxID=51655 RepID=A0A8S4DFU1_PLUXY|nr:unnamed protein product [Plutella xylostella]